VAQVTLDGVTLTRGTEPALSDVTVTVEDGELFAILGASASGKTSLLRVVAGLEKPDAGDVLFDGTSVLRVQPADRDLAMVFQDSTLIPFLSARRNIQFPLDVRSVPRDEIEKRVSSEVRALGIEALSSRYPRQLAVGEMQMVQLARAMVRRPRVLLMDEPLARLDPPLRRKLRIDLKRMQAGYGVTTLFATNDPELAMAISDRGMVLVDGRVVQIGSLQDMYAAPATRLVAELLSLAPVSVVSMRVVGDRSSPRLAAPGLDLYPRGGELHDHIGSEVDVTIRSGDVLLDPVGPVDAIAGESKRSGSDLITRLAVGPASLEMMARGRSPAPGESVHVRVTRFHVFSKDTGRLLVTSDA
jgi:ABC-type sugar transport system ATPase subunit